MNPNNLKELNLYYINDWRHLLNQYEYILPYVLRQWVKDNKFIRLVYKNKDDNYQFFVDKFPVEVLIQLTADEVVEYISPILDPQDIFNIEDVYLD